MVESSVLMMLAVLLPLINIGFINLFGAVKNIRDCSNIAFAFATSFVSFIIAQRVLNGENISVSLFPFLPTIDFEFSAEPLGAIFASIASTLWTITSIYSVGYLRKKKDHHQTRFFVFLSFSIFSAIAISFAGNLLTMFIFYEILTICTYPLVVHKHEFGAVKAGRTYLYFLLGTSVAFFLPAIALVYHFANSVSFSDGPLIDYDLPDYFKAIILMLFAFGIGKAALMPFHRWLPAAMVAPTPVSALLHAVAVVKAGVFCLVKIVVYIYGIENLDFHFTQYLTFIASFTILSASFIALRQTSLKKLLAYSTVSQLAYVILAISIGAVSGAATQIAAHAVAKITLFFVAGALIICAEVNTLSEAKGIGRKLPALMGCFFVVSLSFIGVPFLGGGIAKELILETANSSRSLSMIPYILYISSALNAVYFLRVSYLAFCFKPESKAKISVPAPMMFAILATTALTLGFEFYYNNIIQLVGNL